MLDLSNEVLNIDFSLRAAEILEVKVGGEKKPAGSAGPWRVSVEPG